MARTLDFSNVQGNELLEEGFYELVISKVEEKKSKSGKDMILVTFKHEETGAALWENYVLQDNCLWKLKELFDAVGIDTNGSVAIEWSDLVGSLVNAKVIQEDYNGSMKNRVEKVMPC